MACYALHLASGKLVTLDAQASAVHSDLISDTLYVADGVQLRALFASATRRVAEWQSKVVVLESYKSFAWLAVESDFLDADGSAVTVEVSIYGDLDDLNERELIHSVEVYSRRPVRLPAKRAKEYVIGIKSAARVTSVVVASSTAELQSV